MPPTLDIKVAGYVDVWAGYTEYIIETVHDGNTYTSQQRFSAFETLHQALLAVPLDLPETFPVKKRLSVFGVGEAVKESRREQLEDYLRDCVAASADTFDAALLAFLKAEGVATSIGTAEAEAAVAESVAELAVEAAIKAVADAAAMKAVTDAAAASQSKATAAKRPTRMPVPVVATAITQRWKNVSAKATEEALSGLLFSEAKSSKQQ